MTTLLRGALAITLVGASGVASAEPATLTPQAHADLGLSVVGVGYERPIAAHLAIEGQAGIFGTYFLPWFDAGDDVAGLQVGGRVTWFARASGHGLYVAPYVRGVAVRGELDGESGEGLGFTAGVFAGWAFRAGDRLDVRVGGGAQLIYFDADPLEASTPFIALDVLVGYRL